jgi:hypothetical protein
VHLKIQIQIASSLKVAASSGFFSVCMWLAQMDGTIFREQRALFRAQISRKTLRIGGASLPLLVASSTSSL